MPLVNIPFSVQSARGRTSVASIERLVNLYPEVQPTQAQAPFCLIGASGCRPFCILDDSKVLGLYSAKNKLYALTSEGFYVITKAGDFKCVDKRSFAGHVDFADNGQQIWFTAGRKSYVYKIKQNYLIEITDTDFPGGSSTTYLDGYAIFSRPGTGQFFWSNLLDATDYDALDFASAEGAPDDTIRIIADHRELWLFGEKSVEVWRDVGDLNAPFQRMDGAFIERGAANGDTIVKIDNSVFWVGDDLIIYRAQGYEPIRVSEHWGVEHDLTRYGVKGAYAFTITEEGHTFYWLTLPAANKTWVFDVSSQIWFERSSYYYDQFIDRKENCYSNSYGMHRASCGVMHNGQAYVGDSQSGSIFRLDLDYYQDSDKPIYREAISSPISADRNINVNRLELIMQKPCSGCPKVTLDYTDDLGQTWGGERTRPISRGSSSNKWRAVWRRGGRMFQQRSYRIRTADAFPFVMAGAYLELG